MFRGCVIKRHFFRPHRVHAMHKIQTADCCYRFRTFRGLCICRPMLGTRVSCTTSGQRIFTKGSIAVLSPLAVEYGFDRPWPPTTCFFGRTRVRPQTASGSVQPLLCALQQRLRMLFNGADNPNNCCFPLGDRDQNLIRGSLGPSNSAPKTASPSVQHFSQGSRTWPTHRSIDRQTHTETDTPNSLARTVVKTPKSCKSCHITPILRSLHWLRITERIEYLLTFKVLTTTQPPYIYNLISVQRPRSTRSFIRRYSCSATNIIFSKNNWSLLSPCPWNQLPLSLRQPHSGTSSSISDSPIPSLVTSFSFDSPLCTSTTHSLFHSRLKTYQVSTSCPDCLSRTFARTVSSELLGFCF